MRRSFLKPRISLMATAASAAIAGIGSGPAQAATINWTGGTSFWDIATNWSSNPLLPGATDDVLLGAFNTTFRTGAVTIQSFNGTGTLSVTGGSLGTTLASTTAGLNLSAGTIGGAGNVTLSGVLAWTGGTMTGAGATFANTVTISGATGKTLSGGRILNAGNTTWSGNTGANNTISVANTSAFNSTGNFTDANTFASTISGGTFNNSGTFNKQSNTTTSIGTVFNNTGTVNVNAGTMLMQAGGTSTGLFNIENGATLEFRNGVQTLDNVTTSGAGTLQISTEAGGGVGADAIVTINGGTLKSAFLLSGSRMNGTDQVFQGPATWTGGTINGTAAQSTTFAGTLTISGANGKTLSGGRSVNAGNTLWTGNTGNGNNAISFGGSGTFNNTGSFSDSNTFDSNISAGTFNNNGAFNKQSNTTTSIGTVFNNAGTVNVNAGTMLMAGGGTSSGVFNIAAGAKLEYRNGSHTLNNVTTGGAGTFEISTENVGADAIVSINGGTHTTPFVLSGSTMTGTSHTFQGVAAWTGGTITGAATASTTFANALTISGPNSKTLSGGRSVNAANTTWSGNTGNGNNAIAISGGSIFNSNGTFTDANTFNSAINRGNGGGTFNNSGTFNKQSNTTTSIGTAFNNTGTVNVNAGTMLMTSLEGGTSTGAFNIAAGAKLEYRNGDHTLNNVTTSGAGTFEISTENVGGDAVVTVNGGTHTTPFVLSGSGMNGTDATFKGLATWTGGGISGAATTTFDNDVAISGANLKTIVGGRTVVLNGTTTWSGNTANNNNAIRFWNGATVNNNGTFNDANSFASFIEHNVGGPHNFNNLGTYNKQSSTLTTVDLGVVFNNSGTLNLNAGTMLFSSGTQGPTGTVRVASGATFQIAAASTVGNMITAGDLALADRTLTVSIDYDNANFGVGNAFNRRANVTTSGAATPRLLAAADANQGLSGTGVSNGNTATPTIVIGNVHVGPTTYTYNISNTGTTGPSLRGAIQNAVNGGNITDARLSGNGVLSSNWGPVAPGASISRDITINIGTAGIYAPITGQAVSIVNNFENTRSQLLTFSSAAGAAAYNLASGSATPTPVVLGNQRVGGVGSQALTVSNTAPAGSFTELLNAGFGANTGSATNNAGSVSVAGGNSAAGFMNVGVNTSSAGAKSGTVALNFVSDGSGSSGLGLTPLGSQVINVSGNVYQLAAGQLNTSALNFGTVQVGQSVSQVLSITNSATGAAGFVEDLNARFGATSGTGANLISGSGSIANLLAGATNASAMTVNVNTAGAGSVNGTIAVDYYSAGAVNSVGNGLGELGVGSSSFGVAGTIQAEANVINQASPLVKNAVINLGNVRVGAASPTQAVSITNVATVAPQAALNATVSAAAPITASGSFDLLAPGSTNSAAIVVGMQTATAGAKSGTATVAFVSDASNVGNCAPNCQLGIGTQNVSVSGNVYRLANPTLDAPSVDLVARVGGTSPSAQVGVTNTSPDAFTERLNGSFGSVAPGFVGSGAINGLSAGASSSALALSMNTTSAGTFSGTASVNFVSSGAGTTGAADAALASQQVALGGRVYTPAVGSLNTTVVDFGIVHKGDVVGARNVSVTNAAAIAAPNDVLRGSLGGAAGPFTASGSLAGVAAQATDTSSLSVALNTAGAGVFNGSAAVSFSSHNAEMADLALSGATVALKAQVNNFAELALGKVGGDGALSSAANSYTLDFGTIVLGSTDRAAELGVFNIAAGPADLLNGTFSFAAGSGFSFAGFNPFADIAAGSSLGGFDIVFDSASLGTFSQTITVSSFGTNASGYEGTVFDTTLVLRGTVTDVAAIPEPQTYALMIGGLLAIWAARRRQQRRQAA